MMNGWGFFAAFAWPIAILGSIWILRKEIQKLLPHAYLRFGETEIGFAYQKGLESAAKQLVNAKPDDASELASTGNPRNLTNAQLRENVANIATKMRAMQMDFAKEQNEANMRRSNSNSEDWQSYTRRLSDLSASQAHRWQSELMPQAVALREELRARAGDDYISGGHAHSVALDVGMLAGVYPLNSAASELEQLARLLPD